MRGKGTFSILYLIVNIQSTEQFSDNQVCTHDQKVVTREGAMICTAHSSDKG